MKPLHKLPKVVRNGLMPDLALKHVAKVLGLDDRVRLWRDPKSDMGLMYTCLQAQIQWDPAGAWPCPAPTVSPPCPALPCPALLNVSCLLTSYIRAQWLEP